MTLNGAIIGFGNVATTAHMPLWKKDKRFNIKAVLEPDAQRADKARAMLPGIALYNDMDRMLKNEQLDFVDICSPPCTHKQYITEACCAGLHVLCEKPLVCSVAELFALMATNG